MKKLLTSLVVLGIVLGFAGLCLAKGIKEIGTKSLWGVKAEDLRVKEIIEVIPKTQATKEEILSPDGKKGARIEANEIVIKDLKKGTPTEIRIKAEKEIKRMFWVPDSKKIAYIAGNELWTIDVGKRENRKIVAKLGHYPYDEEFYIDVSPNGEDVAYNNAVDNKSIKGEVMNLKTGKRWVIAEERVTKFYWSPDGERIIVDIEGQPYFLINKNTSEKIVLEEGVGSYPAWSPDGKKVASGHPSLWVMDLETKEMKMLTPWGTRPSWSPDGKKIVYDTYLEISVGAYEERGEKPDPLGDIWIINADGTGKKNLTNTKPLLDVLGGVEWCPEWIDNETIGYDDIEIGGKFIIKLERR